MRFTSLSVSVIARVFLGASLVLGVMRQPVLAQQSTPPLGNNIDSTAPVQPGDAPIATPIALPGMTAQPSATLDISPTATIAATTQATATLGSDLIPTIVPLIPPMTPPPPPTVTPPSEPTIVPPAPPKFEPTDYIDPKRLVGEPLTDPEKTAQMISVTTPGTTNAFVVLDTPRSSKGSTARGVLQVNNVERDAQYDVTVQLPEGVDLQTHPANGATFDPKNRVLVWKNFASKPGRTSAHPFVLKLNFQNPANAPDVTLDITTTLSGGSLAAPVTTTTPIHLGREQSSRNVKKSEGGRVMMDERVTLDFSPEALPQDTPIQSVTYARKPQHKDQLMADIAVTLGPDMAFNAPVTLTFNVSGLINADLLPTLKQRIVLQQVITNKPDDANSKEASTFSFEEVSSSFDPTTGLLTARLAHFSDYVVTLAAPERPKPWKLSTNGGNVSLFRGSMSYAYPFSVPGLPDGLQPILAAEYSSAGGDSRADGQYVPGMHWSLGTGWSVQIPHIARQVRRWFSCSTNVDGNGICWNPYETGINLYDLYTLNMGGQSYNLWHKGGGEYVTEDYSPIRIRRCNSTYSCASYPVVVSNSTNEYWQAWAADGTRYVFGVDVESESPIDSSTGRVWMLRRVYSPLRDDPAAAPSLGKWTIQYNYEQGTGKEYAPFVINTASGKVTPSVDDPWRRPSSIEYGYFTAGANWRNKIVFGYNWLWPQIQTIKVFAGNGTATPTNLMQYQMVRLSSGGEIDGILASGWNGSTWVDSPQTTFRYATYPADANTSGDRYLVNKIQNGYGGEWQYSYAAQPGFGNTRVVNQVITLNGLTGSAGWKRVDTYSYASPCSKSLGSPCLNFGRNAIIDDNDNSFIGFGNATHKSLADVSGTVLTSDIHYFHQDFRRLGREYQSQVYNGDTNTAVVQSSQTTYSIFTGDGTFQLPSPVYGVRATNSKTFPGAIGTTPFQQSNTAYYQSGSAGYTWLVRGNNVGRHLALSVLPASHVAEKRWKLSETAQGGLIVALRACLVEKNANGSWITNTDRSTRITTATGCNTATENDLGIMGYAYPSTSSSSNFTMYLCSGGTDYYLQDVNTCAAGYTSSLLAKASSFEVMGTLSVGDKFGAPSIVEDYDSYTRVRYSAVDYAWNTTASIFKPISNLVYDTNNTLLQETYINYDYNTFYGNVGLKGQTTKVTRSLGTTQAYHYDPTTGNLDSVTDARNNTTTAAYDASGHYMKSMTTPATANAAAGLTTKYGFYGINEGDCGSTLGSGVGSGPIGSLKCVMDANQAVMAYAYDSLGRLTSVVQPLDSMSVPTTQYIYTDNYTYGTAPNNLRGLKVETRVRTQANCATCYLSSFELYDGSGHLVQTRAQKQTNTQVIVSNQQYDALNRVSNAAVPVFETALYGDYSVPDWTSLPKTTTIYDGLSRLTQVTAPDGALTKHYYSQDNDSTGAACMGYSNTSNWVHSIVDANNHSRHQLTNGLGQLVKVREFNGTSYSCSNPDHWQVIGETSYDYDALGQLKKVTDAAGNQTTMAYDALGRKTSMNDPDMGAWSYAYDANGNLTSQTDAKNQTLYFRYDALNRMMEKRLGNQSWGQAVGTIAMYWYDETSDGAWNTNMQNTKGRRTAMIKQDPATGAWENWVRLYYDERGRMAGTRHELGLGATLVTNYTYDSADRVTSMTYPDNEVVTTAYDDGGQPLSLSGTNTYVSSASYNALGQPMAFNLGNTLSQRWYYFGSNLSAPHVQDGNANWSYGKLRQNCVALTTNGECFDWNVRAGGSSNTKLNLY